MKSYILTIQLDCDDTKGEHPRDYFNIDGTMRTEVTAVDKTRMLYYQEVDVPIKQLIPSTFNNSGNKVKKTPQKPSKRF